MSHVSLKDVQVLAPNFKRRLSGVTSTIVQLIPVQNRLGQKVAVIGPGLPPHLPHVRFRDLWRLWQNGPFGAPASGTPAAILKCCRAFSCVMYCA